MSLRLGKAAWTRVILGDVAESSKEKCDPTKGEVDRYVAGEHMDTDDLTIHRWGDVGDGYLGPAFHRRFHPGQVLYGSRRTYLRKVAVADFDGVCANTTFIVQPRDEQILSPEYLPFVMTAEPFHAFAIAESRGSVNPYVNWSDIGRYEFHLPPLDEQKRIADLMWTLERHRDRTAALLAKARSLIDLLSVQLLRQPGPRIRVDKAGQVLMGRQRSPQHATGQHMVDYLRVANIGDGVLRLDDVKQMNFTPEEQRHYGLREGDILVSEGQSRELVGQSAVVCDFHRVVCFQNTLIRFRADPDVVRVQYAQAIFRACLLSGAFSDIATQTTSIAHLGVTRFAALEVPIPSLQEQDHQLEVLNHAVRAEESIVEEMNKVTALRTSLSSAVLGG